MKESVHTVRVLQPQSHQLRTCRTTISEVRVSGFDSQPSVLFLFEIFLEKGSHFPLRGLSSLRAFLGNSLSAIQAHKE